MNCNVLYTGIMSLWDSLESSEGTLLLLIVITIVNNDIANFKIYNTVQPEFIVSLCTQTFLVCLKSAF